MACPVNHCVSDDGCSPNEYGYASVEYGSLEQYRNVVSEIYYKLENLNFANHTFNEENNNVVQVDIMSFNPRKLTVERNGDASWNILYDNKTLILNLKSVISGEERDHLDGGGQGKKKNSYTNG